MEAQGLSQDNERVLVINPGSTSTKFGIYARSGAELEQSILHGDEELERFKGRPMVARLDYRAALIAKALDELGVSRTGESPEHGCPERFAAVAGRGGMLPALPCGTYLVDEAMVEELHLARKGEHASNLGALLALKFAQAAGVNAYIVDPVTVDEWQPVARITGSPLVERTSIAHALNTKAVAKRFAKEFGQSYETLRLIVVHMGSGISVSAHQDGKTIDSNTIEEGPFGPDRTGSLPTRKLIELCFSGAYNKKQLDRMAFGEGGLFAYLGTRDLREVERRMDSGDADAALIYEAMAYQVAKEAGAMAVVLSGKVDALLLTGGMAHSERMVNRLRQRLEWIAPIRVYPGENELQALAEGVFRVLDGVERAKRLREEEHAPAQAMATRGRLVIGLE
jgi:butyrate kinase